jgi:excisionase family DNA binding protein
MPEREEAQRPELLSAQQVAERLSISVRTVQRMVQRGELPRPIRYNRKLIRWPTAEIEAYLKAKLALKRE